MTKLTNQLEMWAGLECTVNRVGDRYFDQCVRNGHDLRPSDYERFKNLGIKRLRYPVLWEKAVRGLDPGERDWSASDRALAEFERLNLPLVIGFLHHGSGPRFTSLIDPKFPELLADYARSVIERYPHLDLFTPVNEPLTTARFCGLYGVWYPHGKDDRTFLKTLMNEVKGTIRAMQAIRSVRPSARLVWTEDFGRAQGTPLLQYQVDFENERRFLSLDLLMGRVDSNHPLYSYVTETAGVPSNDLEWLRANAMKPDLIGINHYPLSNRYIDENLSLFPAEFHGGNAHHRYADVGAINTELCRTLEPADIYRDVWERFRIPCAVTEAHISGGREAQLRWLNRVWHGCQKLRSEGCDLRAVTAWSLLGSYDWNSLCSVEAEFYESGVFDLRAKQPRPTQIARMVSSLAHDGTYTHPVFEDQPLLLITSDPEIEATFREVCAQRSLEMRSLIVDTETENLEDWLREFRPWSVIAEDVSDRQAEVISAAARDQNVPVLIFSSTTEAIFEQTSVDPRDRRLIVRDPMDGGSSHIHSCLDLLIDGEVGIFDSTGNPISTRVSPNNTQRAEELR